MQAVPARQNRGKGEEFLNDFRKMPKPAASSEKSTCARTVALTAWQKGGTLLEAKPPAREQATLATL